MEWEYFNEPIAQSRPQPQQDQSWGMPKPDAGRTLARTGARVGEALAGLPGDITNTGFALGNLASGGYIPTYEDVQNKLPISLPTSHQIKKGFTEKLTGDYLKPKNKGEEFYDEFVGDLATLALPIKGKVPLAGAVKTALSAGAAGFLGETVGGEAGKAAAKTGTLLFSGLRGGRNKLEKSMKEAYKSADIGLTTNPKYNGIPLRNEIHKVSKWAESGIGTPEKMFIGEKAASVKKLIKDGKIAVKDAWEAKKDINSLISSGDTPRKAIPQLELLSGKLSGILEQYGTKKNPLFSQAYNVAEDIFKGLNKRSEVNHFLQQNFNMDKLLTNGLSKFLMGQGIYKIGGLPGVAASGAAGIGSKEAVKAFEFIKNSKQAQHYYKNIMKGAIEKNAATVARNVSGLNKAAEEYESSSNEWEYSNH